MGASVGVDPGAPRARGPLLFGQHRSDRGHAGRSAIGDRPAAAWHVRLLAAGLPGCGRVDDASTSALTVAVFPLLAEIVKTALPLWRQRHPGVDVRLVLRQYGDHHTAMATSLSTAVGLPDVLALASMDVGRLAQVGGLEDLAQRPYAIGQLRDRDVAYADDQAMLRGGAVMAAPADIAPAAMLYRHDLLTRAGVDVAERTGSWDRYLQAGAGPARSPPPAWPVQMHARAIIAEAIIAAWTILFRQLLPSTHPRRCSPTTTSAC